MPDENLRYYWKRADTVYYVLDREDVEESDDRKSVGVIKLCEYEGDAERLVNRLNIRDLQEKLLAEKGYCNLYRQQYLDLQDECKWLRIE